MRKLTCVVVDLRLELGGGDDGDDDAVDDEVQIRRPQPRNDAVVDPRSVIGEICSA